MTIETENAVIESTMLGLEDHGIMTCFLYLNYGGSCQGFGGYALDIWNKEADRRIGTAYGAEFIARVLATVGVEKWEDLAGKHIRARHDWTKVHAIGHIIKDQWFDPEADLASMVKP